MGIKKYIYSSKAHLHHLINYVPACANQIVVADRIEPQLIGRLRGQTEGNIQDRGTSGEGDSAAQAPQLKGTQHLSCQLRKICLWLRRRDSLCPGLHRLPQRYFFSHSANSLLDEIISKLNKNQGFMPLEYLKFLRDFEIPEDEYDPLISNQAFVDW